MLFRSDVFVPSVRELREHLQLSLPEYMIPSAFVLMDKLPLTASGKLDRRALPVPETDYLGVSSSYIPPRTPLEEKLADIWTQVLNVGQVGIHDNFFDLGGHSLLAVQLFRKIADQTGHKLPLAILFQHGTIAQLSDQIVESVSTSELARAIALETKVQSRPLFLMPGLNGEPLFSKELVDRIADHSSVVGIRVRLDASYLETFNDFGRTAAEVVNAIRTYQPTGPYALAGFSYGGFVAQEVACQLQRAGEQVDLLAIIDTGPGESTSPSGFVNTTKTMWQLVENFPRWAIVNFSRAGFINAMRRTGRKTRYLIRWIQERGRATYSLDDEFGPQLVDNDRIQVKIGRAHV